MLDRELSTAFYLYIPLNDDSDSINQKLEESLLIEELTRQLMDGKISPSDYFELVESTSIDIDSYIDEVEANVIDTISTTNELTDEQKGWILYGL